MSIARKIGLAMICYSVGFWLTFGWTYNRPDRCTWPTEDVVCTMKHEIGSITAAVFWPGYWAGRLAIEVTKP